MSDDFDPRAMRRERAIDSYQREHRFRGMVRHIVHAAMKKRGIFNADELTYRTGDIARMFEDVAAQVLQMVYEEDAELARLKQERDAYKKLAEESVGFRPMAPIFVSLAEGEAKAATTLASVPGSTKPLSKEDER